MPYTQADADKLREAIATGARRIKFEDGREVEYRSLAEMRQTLDQIEDEVANNGRRSTRTSYAVFDRG